MTVPMSTLVPMLMAGVPVAEPTSMRTFPGRFEPLPAPESRSRSPPLCPPVSAAHPWIVVVGLVAPVLVVPDRVTPVVPVPSGMEPPARLPIDATLNCPGTLVEAAMSPDTVTNAEASSTVVTNTCPAVPGVPADTITSVDVLDGLSVTVKPPRKRSVGSAGLRPTTSAMRRTPERSGSRKDMGPQFFRY